LHTNIRYKNLHPCPAGVTIKCAEVKSENEKNNIKAWASSRWASDVHIHIILSLRLFFFSSDDPADPRSGSADLRAPIPNCRAVVGRPTVLLRYTYPPLNQLVIIYIYWCTIILCTRDRVQVPLIAWSSNWTNNIIIRAV